MTEINNFYNLISKYNIKIPNLQRDYAQGRDKNDKVKKIRTDFLDTIYDTLSNDNNKLSLNFIYGTIEETQSSIQYFIPLDGQQRLTTLFLLYLYLAEDNSILIHDNKSKFAYETRESTKDFIQKLTLEIKNIKDIQDIQDKKTEGRKISKIIKDQQWYMYEWNNDPSIKGILVMLDSIVEKFGINKTRNNEMAKRLQNIEFSFLDLNKYRLSEELYIKMNSRGKDLSRFDIFKSTLEEELIKNCNDENIKKKWYENIDTNWINLFWKYFKNEDNKIQIPNDFIKDKCSENDNEYNCIKYIEECFLNFFTGLISLYIYEYKSEIEYKEKIFLYEMIEQQSVLDIKAFTFLVGHKIFDENFFKYIIQVFENLILEGDIGIKKIENFYNKDFYFFDEFCNKGEKSFYESRLKMFSFFKFVQYIKIEDIYTKQKNSEEFQNYMRIIYNLTNRENTNFYNKAKDFLDSIKTISKFTKEIYEDKKNTDILEYFSDDNNEIIGFNKRQIEEERIKAKLLKEEPKIWKNLIRIAEEHPYFCGQIYFLFNWVKSDNGYDSEKFKTYFYILNNNIFNKNKGIREDLVKNNIFRRCLLATKDYTIKIGKYYTFIKNEGKDRDFSWKTYLRNTEKNNILKTLLDSYVFQATNTSIISFFENKIKELKNNITDWRKYFILEPKVFDYMQEYKFERKDDELYLLNKKTKKGPSVELKNYYSEITK